MLKNKPFDLLNFLKILFFSFLSGLLWFPLLSILVLLTLNIANTVQRAPYLKVDHFIHINSKDFPEMENFKSESEACSAFLNVSNDSRNITIPNGKEDGFYIHSVVFSFVDTKQMMSQGSIHCISKDKIKYVEENKEDIGPFSKDILSNFGIQTMNFSTHINSDEFDDSPGLRIEYIVKNTYFYFIPKSKITPELLSFLKSKKAYFITEEGKGLKMYESDLSWKYDPATLPDPIPVIFTVDNTVK